ncbi:NAD-aldehyde dehydrogenase [Thelephora terrestris]|uniref:Aldehyde dehydrogenase n=1 Tax=Thelephora terrestris TaxID=56493 RepID=A0A9P6HFG5_9AGAM|nr:NAD-aldehyde dehydrogenase [Thelephora terrestris]
MVDPSYTPIDEVQKIHASLQASFKSGKARDIKYRKHQLLQLAYLLKDNKDRFNEAAKQDLGRSYAENEILELYVSLEQIKYIFDNFEKWTKPESVELSIYFGARPRIRKEPKGVVLIFVPFNYPIMLLMSPLAGAIAAGNAACVKVSELLPATSSLLVELFPKYLDPSLYCVVNGDVAVSTKLLELPWDHILYTGSGRVGKIVAEAAAKHLTPITLELGGKCPTIVDPRVNLKVAAKRILWGRTSNAGQTCVAPDYVLIPKDGEEDFIAALKETYLEFYPKGTKEPGTIARLPNRGNFDRVKRLLDDTKGTVVLGGDTDRETKYVAPTIVRDVRFDDSLMSEEIFAPILPIVPVNDFDEAIEFINARDHPLALYIFTDDSKLKEKVFSNTRSGSCVCNEVVLQIPTPGLPFGGFGASGNGGYHTGKYSFDIFTHQRSTLTMPNWMEIALAARYPPFSDKKSRMVESLSSPSFPPRDSVLNPRGWWRKWVVACLTLGVSLLWAQRRKLIAH